MLGAGARAVVVTRGARGASLTSLASRNPGCPRRRSPSWTPSGAGDAFNGALAVSLSAGEGLRHSVRWAVAAGAAACTGAGARGALPTRADVEALTRR